MSQYILAPLADADIADILLYVMNESGLAAADRLEDEFHEAMQRIAEAPGIGRSRIDIAGETFRFVTLHKPARDRSSPARSTGHRRYPP